MAFSEQYDVVVVGRYVPDFIAFQQRLSVAGKPRKVIRIALAHKLLVRLNAKAREVRQQLAASELGAAQTVVMV
jgi:transposase